MLENSVLAQRFERLLHWRRRNGALRELSTGVKNLPIDFASNDYLGLARAHRRITGGAGSTGSRLLTGGTAQALNLEAKIAEFHAAPAALLFNSGYDANIGWAQAVLRANDTVLCDAEIHASIHDGLRLAGLSPTFFAHNDSDDLAAKLQAAKAQLNAGAGATIFVLVESVYSMSGQVCPLLKVSELCEQHGALLMVDEAHAFGVFGKRGAGLVQRLQLQDKIWLRLHTYGKALGAHGAAILGSDLLKSYLSNYARSLMYTTALPPHALSAIEDGYDFLQSRDGQDTVEHLRDNIAYFCQKAQAANLPAQEQSPIQAFFCPAGNVLTKKWAAHFQANDIDLRPIFSPTVENGTQRLRICLHAFNSEKEMDKLWQLRAEIERIRI